MKSVLACVAPAYSQPSPGRILGVVRDSTGAPVPGATVTITNQATGAVQTVTSSADGSYSAYVPDLPGCVACGDTMDEVRALIDEAVHLHIQSLREHNEPVPPPTVTTHKVQAA